MLTEWTEENEPVFAEACAAVRDDLAEGARYESSIEHYSALYEIAPAALDHDCRLRNIPQLAAYNARRCVGCEE